MHALFKFVAREKVTLSWFSDAHVHEYESNWRPILGILRNTILLKSLVIMEREDRFRPKKLSYLSKPLFYAMNFKETNL